MSFKLSNLHAEIMGEIDIWLRQQDINRDHRLGRQLKKILKQIELIWIAKYGKESILNKSLYSSKTAIKLKQIERYVRQYRWIPDSYKTMLHDMAGNTQD